VDWIDLPCIFNHTKTLETTFRKSSISFARSWKENKVIDQGSTALYVSGNKAPVKVVLPIESVSDLLPDLIPFTMANKETVLINPNNVNSYRGFVDAGSPVEKWILYLAPVCGEDSFFIVTTPVTELFNR